jgi:hypothetical protein
VNGGDSELDAPPRPLIELVSSSSRRGTQDEGQFRNLSESLPSEIRALRLFSLSLPLDLVRFEAPKRINDENLQFDQALVRKHVQIVCFITEGEAGATQSDARTHCR